MSFNPLSAHILYLDMRAVLMIPSHSRASVYEHSTTEIPHSFSLSFFTSWTKRSKILSVHTKDSFISYFVYEVVKICVMEHLSFAKIICPLNRFGISRSWLNSITVVEMCFGLISTEGHSKMSSFITQHNSTDASGFWGVCTWRADCRNVHQSCCPS